MGTSGPPLVVDPSLLAPDVPRQLAIGSVWRRILALCLDGIIISNVVHLAAPPFFDDLSKLGAWGRLVGFCIALPYFSLLNSARGNGQTLGKRLLRLQVVNKNGALISVRESVLRYAVLALPWFLNQIELPITRNHGIVLDLNALIVFGLGGGTIYLVLFNGHTRQGAHDLTAGTYVVAADGPGNVRTQATWKGHWVVLGCVMVVLPLGLELLGQKLATKGVFPQLFDDAELIERIDGAQSENLQEAVRSDPMSGETQRTLVLTVGWSGGPGGEKEFADHVAGVILQHDPTVSQYSSLRVVIVRGYDLGIASSWVSHSYAYTPDEWNFHLHQK